MEQKDGEQSSSQKRKSFLDMEIFMCSNWPELGNWILCEEANKRDFSSLFPMPLSAESSGFASCSVPRGEVREDDGPSDASTVSKSHSLAEERGRHWISVQLSRLRNLVPYSDKMDKASLLSSVVQQVKYLKREAKEVCKVLTLPSDFDEVIIDCFLNKDESSTSNSNTTEKIYICASICCEDRPNLFPELSQVLKNLGLQITRAEMACSGGRINSVMILSPQNGKEDVCISNAVQSLKVMLGRIALFSTRLNSNRSRSKRQSFFDASL